MLSSVLHKGPGVAGRIVQQLDSPGTRETTRLSREQAPLTLSQSAREKWMKKAKKKKKKRKGKPVALESFVTVCGSLKTSRWTRQTETRRGRKEKGEEEHGSPVACSWLIERSSSMREINEIRTCGTSTQVRPRPTWLWVNPGGHPVSMGASVCCLQRGSVNGFPVSM